MKKVHEHKNVHKFEKSLWIWFFHEKKSQSTKKLMNLKKFGNLKNLSWTNKKSSWVWKKSSWIGKKRFKNLKKLHEFENNVMNLTIVHEFENKIEKVHGNEKREEKTRKKKKQTYPVPDKQKKSKMETSRRF